MHEEETAWFSEPCTQCSEVNWTISDEGRFYCRSCHNAIERTREVVDVDFSQGSSRISNVSRGSRTKKQEHGVSSSWCEGFQFILQQQAEALIRLRVTSDFKDSTLWPMWTLYLQRSGQAFCDAPSKRSNRRAESDSGGDESILSSVVSGSSGADSDCDWSDRPPNSFLWQHGRRSHSKVMTMRRTLALIHVCVLWNRECVTLSHLLRLVREGHVPFLRASELIPDQMKFVGKEALMFNAKTIPSHRSVLLDSQHLVHILQLPVFPPISREHPLHPLMLALNYLMDANLPDQLHQWVSRVEDLSQLGSASSTHTEKGSALFPPPYDLQAAALIIVTMKLLFGLDDHTEWDLSNNLEEASADVFSLRRWYRIVHSALLRAQSKEEELTARRRWNPTVPTTRTHKERHLVMKRKRISEQVQSIFRRLSSPPCNHVTSNGDHVTSNGDHVTSNGDHVTSNGDHVTSNGDHVTSNGDHVTSNGDHVTSNGDHVTSDGDHVTSNGDHVTSDGDHVTSDGDHVTSDGDHVTSFGDHVTSDGPSIFSFCWGGGASSDGPSLHHQMLTHPHTHPVYWHRPLQPCHARECAHSHFLSDEASLPRSFLWLLQLFSFLLRVSTAELYQETLKLERRVFGCRTPGQRGTDSTQEVHRKKKRKKKVTPRHNKSL